MWRWLLLLPIALAAVVAPSAGQSLVRNQQGDYVLTYTDLNDTVRTLLMEAPDQTDASVSSQVSATGGSFAYDYTVSNGPTARHAIQIVDILCPAGDPTLTASSPASWNASAAASGKLDDAPGWLCSYVHRPGSGPLIGAGTALSGLRIASTWLPAVRPARAFGLTEPYVLPTIVEDTPDTVLKLVERAQGFGFFTGGGLRLSVVAPARPPARGRGFETS